MSEPTYHYVKGQGWVPSVRPQSNKPPRYSHIDSPHYPSDLNTICNTCNKELADHWGDLQKAGGVRCDVFKSDRLFT